MSESITIIPNIPAASGQGLWDVAYRMSRAMLKAGWKHRASYDDTTFIISEDPLDSIWHPYTDWAVSSSGSGATVDGTVTNGRVTVTGLTGLVSAQFGSSKGMFLRDSTNNKLYQIEEVLDATSCRIDARAVAPVAGVIDWEVRDPSAGTFTLPVPNVNPGEDAWVVLRGPSVLLVPLAVAPGTPLNEGEIMEQDATGLQGELVGYFLHPGGGGLVLKPRFRGTGANNYGSDNSGTWTGADSGGQIVQTAPVREFYQESIIWRDSFTSFRIQVHTLELGVDTPPSANASLSDSPPSSNLGFGTAGGFSSSGESELANSHVYVGDAIEEPTYSANRTAAAFVFNGEDVASVPGTAGTQTNRAFWCIGQFEMDDTHEQDVERLAVTPNTPNPWSSQAQFGFYAYSDFLNQKNDPVIFYYLHTPGVHDGIAQIPAQGVLQGRVVAGRIQGYPGTSEEYGPGWHKGYMRNMRRLPSGVPFTLADNLSTGEVWWVATGHIQNNAMCIAIGPWDPNVLPLYP